jgi:hypothetical protein
MNVQQFRAILWLRWRLYLNHLRRMGTALAVFEALIHFFMLGVVAAAFLASFPIGMRILPGVGPAGLLLVWDGFIALFLMTWLFGLIVNLVRAEGLSVRKILHLPVSPAGAVLVDYFTSLLNVPVILFAPAMAGLSVGLAIATRPVQLLSLPLLAAFVLSAMALTQQVQASLAAAMTNPRRRRTLLVLFVLGFVLLVSLAAVFTVVSVVRPRDIALARSAPQALAAVGGRISKLLDKQRELLGTILRHRAGNPADANSASDLRSATPMQSVGPAPNDELGRALNEFEWKARLANLLLPPGWLALGVAAAAEGSPWPALLGTAGLMFLGLVSLRRSYRTILGLHTGQFNQDGPRTLVRPRAKARLPAVSLLERRLPFISGPASAVALATVQSLIRAPEAKILLFGPLLIMAVVAAVFFGQAAVLPDRLLPMLGGMAAGMSLGATLPLIGNQFGFDRGGFRVFMLSGVARRDILLGKNLAVAPLVLGPGILAATALQIVHPMPLDLFVTAVPQCIPAYLLLCLLANLMSILAPLPVRAGGIQGSQPKATTMLLHMASLFLLMFALFPVLLPMFIVMGLHESGYLAGVPACLSVTLAQCVIVGLLYRLLLNSEGVLLQIREQKILEVIAPKAE